MISFLILINILGAFELQNFQVDFLGISAANVQMHTIDTVYHNHNSKLIHFKTESTGLIKYFFNIDNSYETIISNDFNTILSFKKKTKQPNVSNKFETSRLKEETMALEVMSFLGIDNFEAKFLSGQPYAIQKLVEIARALISKPKLILLDEPAAGMNDQETLEISKIILEIRDILGITVLLVEHDMNLVMKISDRICVLDSGRIIALGNPEKVKNNPDVVRSYLGDNGNA